MTDIKKTNVQVVPVTAEINGERVVVGEASVIMEAIPSVDATNAAADPEEPKLEVTLDLETPEGLSLDSALNKGLLNAISVSSDKSDLISKVAERSKKDKKDKEENPDDGTVGTE